MANEQAWNQGWAMGQNLAAERRARKEMLSDEDRQRKFADLFEARQNIRDVLLPAAVGDAQKAALHSAAGDIQLEMDRLYHPAYAPGALQKDWHKLVGLITKKKAAPVLSTTTEPGTAPADVTLNGQTVAMPATPPYQTVSEQPSAMTREQKLNSAQVEKAHREAEMYGLGAPLSPEQTALQAGLAKGAGLLGEYQGMMKTLDAMDIPAEEKARLRNDLVDRLLTGTTSGKNLKLYQLADGTKFWADATRPEMIPPGATAVGAENADTRKRADFAAYLKEHPDYKGTFEQWTAEQSQLAKRAVPTNRDDRYIAIEEKRQLGQPVGEDDKAYAAAWDLYINKRVIAPGVARAAAFGAMRYVQVMDRSDPEKVVFMRAGDAAKAGVGTPASIGYQTDKAMSRYMTVGAGGQNLNYFNTAVDHLKLLSETADALNNSNYPLVNQWANAYATATGDPAPTNFNAVKNAVAGELSKVFKGTGATNEEISLMNETINNAMSPAEITGAIHYYTRLMDGKIHGLRAQYESGRTGQPAFPEAPAATPAPGAPVKSKGLVSITEAMKKQKYQKMTRDQVRQAIMDQGFTPTE